MCEVPTTPIPGLLAARDDAEKALALGGSEGAARDGPAAAATPTLSKLTP